eukprot:CAMPEP_0117431704 /NCGR_PEP_ID=MMETSP0758-20121206/11244_1 /TAXON_ID=63605 /ORGANISM="Percolomonas cosmopolitus, Strain AE-1 (ATCC 50343)" /LENGTH=169 /DNA_ID=CAMNT_0005220991 /DNA_START=154 /DNA_END=659 /DNA_ORIENTATION=-
MALPTDKLMAAAHIIEEYDVIGIDEGQFFPDIKEFAEYAANKNKVVIVAALDGTFERKTFGDVCELIPKAEKVTKLLAVCAQCQADAAFSKRLTQETSTVCVGGAEKYIAVCRECYFDTTTTPTKKKQQQQQQEQEKKEEEETPNFVTETPQQHMLTAEQLSDEEEEEA